MVIVERIKCLHLRCTLMGFERNYQVGILSNQNIQRQIFIHPKV